MTKITDLASRTARRIVTGSIEVIGEVTNVGVSPVLPGSNTIVYTIITDRHKEYKGAIPREKPEFTVGDRIKATLNSRTYYAYRSRGWQLMVKADLSEEKVQDIKW